MDFKKINGLSKSILEIEKALKMLNSGEPCQLQVTNLKETATITVLLSPDDKSIYALSESVSKALHTRHIDLSRQLVANIR